MSTYLPYEKVGVKTDSGYQTDTLLGNWNEERFDINYMGRRKPLPSEFAAYYETTKGVDIDKKGPHQVPDLLKTRIEREKFAYAGHQPEFDHPKVKADYNSFLTVSKATYVNHFQPCANKCPGANASCTSVCNDKQAQAGCPQAATCCEKSGCQ